MKCPEKVTTAKHKEHAVMRKNEAAGLLGARQMEIGSIPTSHYERPRVQLLAQRLNTLTDVWWPSSSNQATVIASTSLPIHSQYHHSVS
jgi:hypothetical protein